MGRLRVLWAALALVGALAGLGVPASAAGLLGAPQSVAGAVYASGSGVAWSVSWLAPIAGSPASYAVLLGGSQVGSVAASVYQYAAGPLLPAGVYRSVQVCSEGAQGSACSVPVALGIASSADGEVDGSGVVSSVSASLGSVLPLVFLVLGVGGAFAVGSLIVRGGWRG